MNCFMLIHIKILKYIFKKTLDLSFQNTDFKPDKIFQKMKIQIQLISNYVKILTQILANRIHQHKERITYHDPIRLCTRIPSSFENRKTILIIHSI